MRPNWHQRMREWICHRIGHRPYDDGNVIACRRCYVLIGRRGAGKH